MQFLQVCEVGENAPVCRLVKLSISKVHLNRRPQRHCAGTVPDVAAGQHDERYDKNVELTVGILLLCRVHAEIFAFPVSQPLSWIFDFRLDNVTFIIMYSCFFATKTYGWLLKLRFYLIQKLRYAWVVFTPPFTEYVGFFVHGMKVNAQLPATDNTFSMFIQL